MLCQRTMTGRHALREELRTSGSVIIPTNKMLAQMNWSDIGSRQAEWLARSFVALSTTDATRIPIVIAHW